jgi:hypothetical protein
MIVEHAPDYPKLSVFEVLLECWSVFQARILPEECPLEMVNCKRAIAGYNFLPKACPLPYPASSCSFHLATQGPLAQDYQYEMHRNMATGRSGARAKHVG